MQGAQGDRLQDEHIQSALQKIELFFHLFVS
jgi:hypothetical protein